MESPDIKSWLAYIAGNGIVDEDVDLAEIAKVALERIQQTETKLDARTELLRELEFFLRGRPGEASLLRAKIQEALRDA